MSLNIQTHLLSPGRNSSRRTRRWLKTIGHLFRRVLIAI